MKDFLSLLKQKSYQIAKCKQEYSQLEREYIDSYKANIVRKYMRTWEKSGKFAADPELVNVIFHLANLELDDTIPQVSISLLNHKLTLTYFNRRLSKWIELTPQEEQHTSHTQKTQDFLACEICNYKEIYDPNSTNIKCPSCNKPSLVRITLCIL